MLVRIVHVGDNQPAPFGTRPKRQGELASVLVGFFSRKSPNDVAHLSLGSKCKGAQRQRTPEPE